MASTYRENLINTVLENSYANNWTQAVEEWEITDCVEDENRSESCICGKEELRYQYEIHFPIGSSCIKKFERDDLREETTIAEGMFKLLHAVQENQFIELSSELFSKKVLKALYDRGAFLPTKYNNFDGYNDYKFMLDMFNKRIKANITSSQKGKISAIIMASIKPYLEEELESKIK